MNRHTFSRAVKQLVELGFIEKSDFGGLYRENERLQAGRELERCQINSSAHFDTIHGAIIDTIEAIFQGSIVPLSTPVKAFLAILIVPLSTPLLESAICTGFF